MGWWQDLRDRRLFQIVAGYAAAGWLVLEGVDQFVARGILPEVGYRLVLVLYLAGLPASAIIGWFHGEKGAQQAPRIEIVLLALVAVVGLGGAGLVVRNHVESVPVTHAEASSLDLRRIGVLYFEDLTPDGELTHIADGLTEELIDRLDRVGQLDVVSPNGVARFRDADVTRDSIARALDVGTLISGSVEREGSGLRVTTRLLDGETGALIRRGSFRLPEEQILAIQDSLASSLALDLRDWLGDEVEYREARSKTRSVAAWTFLQRAERSRKDGDRLLAHHDPREGLARLKQADSLLALAERSDTTWTKPVVERSRVAFRRARAAAEVGHDAAEAGRLIQAGIQHANRALAIDRNYPPAFEMRGTLRYYAWLLQLSHDAEQREALRKRAVDDLETAVELDPTLARAHAVLSHAYYLQNDMASVVLAARKAYEEDAYLNDAPGILHRLFWASYDMEQFPQARRWCEEGARRFPGDHRFTRCRLWLMAAPGGETDIGRAWELVRRVDSLLPEQGAEAIASEARIVAGGVIGRASLRAPGTASGERLRDSARAVWRRAEVGAGVDPNRDLLSYEAAMRTIIGDEDTAVELLQEYVAANPDHSFVRGQSLNWWWRDLQDHPGFQEMVGGH